MSTKSLNGGMMHHRLDKQRELAQRAADHNGEACVIFSSPGYEGATLYGRVSAQRWGGGESSRRLSTCFGGRQRLDFVERVAPAVAAEHLAAEVRLLPDAALGNRLARLVSEPDAFSLPERRAFLNEAALRLGATEPHAS